MPICFTCVSHVFKLKNNRTCVYCGYYTDETNLKNENEKTACFKKARSTVLTTTY